jgi:hypothetical protein
MSSGSFFIHRPEDALRHITLLTKGLRQVGIAGLVAGGVCSLLAILLSRFIITPLPQSSPVPGSHEISGVAFATWFMAIAFLVYSGLYLAARWGLARREGWARYVAAAAFLSKILLCAWLGRGSVVAMILFLLIAGCDIYGLWVLLSKETAQLFSSPETSQAGVKPANLVT